jgi:inhibitor of KinA
MPSFQLLPAGDSALRVSLPELIDPEVNAWCIALGAALEERLGSAVRDAVVGYCSVTVYFDPLRTDVVWLEEEVRSIADATEPREEAPSATHHIPVCYGGSFGPDLSDVARFGGCSEEDVIAIHAGTEYRVYLVGFVPGFAYMARVADRIAAPRRAAPRTTVLPGSVAIAGGQTGIYPAPTPGGWNIIGCTPVKPYDAERSDPFLFKPGDRVRFEPVTTDEYHRLSGRTA